MLGRHHPSVMASICWGPVYVNDSAARSQGLFGSFLYSIFCLYLLSLNCCLQTNQDLFLKTFFECLATAKGTLAHKYVSLLFTVDGLQHQLLKGIRGMLELVGNRFDISISCFMDLRVSMIEGKRDCIVIWIQLMPKDVQPFSRTWKKACTMKRWGTCSSPFKTGEISDS